MFPYGSLRLALEESNMALFREKPGLLMMECRLKTWPATACCSAFASEENSTLMLSSWVIADPCFLRWFLFDRRWDLFVSRGSSKVSVVLCVWNRKEWVLLEAVRYVGLFSWARPTRFSGFLDLILPRMESLIVRFESYFEVISRLSAALEIFLRR